MTDETTETSLIIAADLEVIDLFTSEKMDPLLEKIRAAVEGFVPDTSTSAGRAEIKAMAFKVTRSKTLIDDSGKKLVSGWKEKSRVVDQSRKTAREFLTDLAKDVRAPLTEWEIKESERKEKERIAEENRISNIREKIAAISAVPIDCVGMNYVSIMEKLYELEDVIVDETGYAEFVQAAWTAKEEAVAKMRSLRDAVQLQEEAKKQAEKERVEREEAEAARVANQKVEDDERQKKLDEESAKLEEDRKKLAEDQAEIDKEKAAIAAEKEKAIEPPKPPEKVESLPAAKYDAKGAALNAMTMIVDEECAVMVLDAIMNGDIDHVTFNGTTK